MVISLNLTNLKIGYEAVQRSEQKLRNRWRKPLVEKYSEQRLEYDSLMKIMKLREKNRKLAFGVGFGLIGFFFLIGVILSLLPFVVPEGSSWAADILCIGPIFCVLSLGGLIVLGGIAMYLPKPSQPDIPERPMDAFDQLVKPELTEQWMEALAVKTPTKGPDEGITGELLFLEKIKHLSKQMFVLHRLVQKNGDDLDVVLIGSKGIWLFEVKYWKGSIQMENGEWQKSKKYKRRTGDEITDVRHIEQPPNTQWRRMKKDLVHTIERNHPDKNCINTIKQSIYGGVVFTHPQSRFDIPKNAGFNWGNIPFWVQQIDEAKTIPYFEDLNNIFEILDVFLARHQQVTKPGNLVSMLDVARYLESYTNQLLSDFCRN